MNSTPSAAPGNTWLAYTFITVFSWGVYGILLHKGQLGMADAANGRYKAFLFVGVAYFITAVLAPLVLLMSRGATMTYPTDGWSWSLIAGVAGAIGAFGTLLAFGAKGNPAVVMTIVFGGAPVVNAAVALYLYRNEINFNAINPLFYAGLLLAVGGGGLVTKFKPNPAPKKPGVVAPAMPKAAAASAASAAPKAA